MADDSKIRGGVDSISTLPDVILQHITFIPTELAITTSLLSKRWRHVWCDIPSLSFHGGTLKAASYYSTQNRYTAPKMTSLHLQTGCILNTPHINTWLELAMSRNVENLSLLFLFYRNKYNFPDFFYINSSLKQLSVEVYFTDMMIPKCSMSWTSLKKFSLRWSTLSDESIAKILSSCPILECLTLYFCHKLTVLDLNKSMRLRTLQLVRNFWVPEPMDIVAPHTHCLRLRNSQSPCAFVDASSLTEAKLSMCFEVELSIGLARDQLGLSVWTNFLMHGWKIVILKQEGLKSWFEHFLTTTMSPLSSQPSRRH